MKMCGLWLCCVVLGNIPLKLSSLLKTNKNPKDKAVRSWFSFGKVFCTILRLFAALIFSLVTSNVTVPGLAYS